MKNKLEPMRLLVCGGRDYLDWHVVWFRLGQVHAKRTIGVIISGGCKGVDTFAADWARKNNIQIREHYAAWEKHGPAAGPIRNQQMIDDGKPDGAIAFPGGKGTADMKLRCQVAGITLWEPSILPEPIANRVKPYPAVRNGQLVKWINDEVPP